MEGNSNLGQSPSGQPQPAPQQQYKPAPQQHYQPASQQQYQPAPQQYYQPAPHQQYQPAPQQYYQPATQQHYQHPLQYSHYTSTQPQISEFSVGLPHDRSREKYQKPFPLPQQQTEIITTQPGAYPAKYRPRVPPSIQQNTNIDSGEVQAPPELYVPNEMGCSIFTTFCCCLILGIIAMIFASQANGLKHVDPQRALAKAKTAKILNLSAIVLGISSIVVVVVLQYAVLNRRYY